MVKIFPLTQGFLDISVPKSMGKANCRLQESHQDLQELLELSEAPQIIVFLDDCESLNSETVYMTDIK